MDPEVEDDETPLDEATRIAQEAEAGGGGLFAASRKQAEESLQERYKKYADALRAQRVGRPVSGRIADALIAYGQPASSFGEAIGNAALQSSKDAEARRAAAAAREEMLAKVEFEKGTRLDELRMKYDLEAAKLAAKATKGAGAEKMERVLVDDAGNARHPFNNTILPKGVIGVTQYGNMVMANGMVVPQGTPLSALEAKYPAGAPAGPAVGIPATGKGLPAKTVTMGGFDYVANEDGSPGAKIGPTPSKMRAANPEEAAKYGYLRGSIDESTGKFEPLDKEATIDRERATFRGVMNSTTEMNRVMRQIDETLPKINSSTVGLVGSALKFIPGSGAKDVDALMSTVRSGVIRTALNKMREGTSTGASGLGSITEKELRMLEDSVASLDAAQTPEQFAKQLKIVRSSYAAWKTAADRYGAELALADRRRKKGSEQASPAAPAKGKVNLNDFVE